MQKLCSWELAAYVFNLTLQVNPTIDMCSVGDSQKLDFCST